MYSPQFQTWLTHITNNDWQAIEFARDNVKAHHLAEAAKAYPTLTWEQKSTLIQLVQDTISSETKSMMRDFLNAPPYYDDDSIWMSKAIAICHLENDFKRFDEFLGMGNQELEAYVPSWLERNPPD